MPKDYEHALFTGIDIGSLCPISMPVSRVLAAIYIAMPNIEKVNPVKQEIFEIYPRFTLSGVRKVPFQHETDCEHYFVALHM